MWKETFRFHITMPELAFLRFQVFNGDTKLTSDVVGCYTIKLDNLEQGRLNDFFLSFLILYVGYRHTPLYNRRGEIIRFSTLFLYISFA